MVLALEDVLCEWRVLSEGEASLVFLLLALNDGDSLSVGVLEQQHGGGGGVDLEEVIPVKIALDVVDLVPEVVAASWVNRGLNSVEVVDAT